MRRVGTVSVLGLLGLVGCYSESEFVPDRASAYCSYVLECSDAATLAFDGLDWDSCLGLWGPTFLEESNTCDRFSRSLAKQCVSALEITVCPTDGSAPEDNLPEVCDFVFSRCVDEPAPVAE